MPEIGQLNEQPLHAALKIHYAQPSYPMEVTVDGYIIDVLRGEQLIEVQTGNFSTIKSKVARLAEKFPVKVVYPIALRKWLLKLPENGQEKPKRRKSPKQGSLYQVFGELVSFPEMINVPGFSLDIVLIEEEEVRKYTGEKPWRQRGWVTVERRLIRVLDCRTFANGQDFMDLLPAALPSAFTTRDLAKSAGIPRWLAQKAAYCLRKMGTIRFIGKKGRSNLYERF